MITLICNIGGTGCSLFYFLFYSCYFQVVKSFLVLLQFDEIMMSNTIVFRCVFQKIIWFHVCFDRWIMSITLIVEFICRIIVSYIKSGIRVLHPMQTIDYIRILMTLHFFWLSAMRDIGG